MCCDTRSSDTGIVWACLNTFSRQKVHVIAKMSIITVIFCICAGMIPGVETGDK